jgi:hypothetical protein
MTLTVTLLCCTKMLNNPSTKQAKIQHHFQMYSVNKYRDLNKEKDLNNFHWFLRKP